RRAKRSVRAFPFSFNTTLKRRQGQSVDTPFKPAHGQAVASDRGWRWGGLGPIKGWSDNGDCTAVLGSTGGRRAVCDLALAPEGCGTNALGRHTHLDQSLLHGLRPLPRKAKIVGEGPDVVGMALHDDGQVRMMQEPFGLRLERQSAACAKFGTGLPEENPVADRTLEFSRQPYGSPEPRALLG